MTVTLVLDGEMNHTARVTPQNLGRYEILRILGRGAAAVVYLARDPVIDRLVALKTLRADLDSGEGGEFRARFLREARAVGRLHHPGIVTIFDAGEDTNEGVLFIAMEYVLGNTLKEVLQLGVPLDCSQIATLGWQLAQTLDYAHKNGVIHRDIKPANIMLTAHSKTKIADFGVARLGSSEMTVEGTIIGTPSYMSPEQIDSEMVDGRSDLYSLGVVCFELLTRSLPYRAGSLSELSLKILHQEVPDITTLRPDVPKGWSEVIKGCLAKRREDRYQTGEELASALRRFIPNDGASKIELSNEEIIEVNDATLPAFPVDEAILLTSQTRAIVIEKPANTGKSLAKDGGGKKPRARPRLGRIATIIIALGTVLLLASFWWARFGGKSPDIVKTTSDQELIKQAELALTRGDTNGAIAAAQLALQIDPSSGPALEILNDAKRRLQEESRPAGISLDFISPVSPGNLVLTLDGKYLDTIRWDFSRKIIFGIKVQGKGKVHTRFETPPGRHELAVKLQTSKDGILGEAVFTEVFPPASQWLLGVEMAKKKDKPKFVLKPQIQNNPAPKTGSPVK